jgi:hypothetical protein
MSWFDPHHRAVDGFGREPCVVAFADLVELHSERLGDQLHRSTPYGIRVNTLAPDIMLTDGMLAMMEPGAESRFGPTAPPGRAGHVDEIACAAVFLVSDLASYITGQTIHVDGGTAAAGGWYHHPDTGQYTLGPPETHWPESTQSAARHGLADRLTSAPR